MALLLAAATVGAACGSDNSSSDAPTTTAASATTAAPAGSTATGDSTVTSGGDTAPAGAVTPIDNGEITHWQHHSDARAALVEGFIGTYAAEGGAKINFESIPYSDYFVRLGGALEAGNGPCVFQLPANILAEFEARGQLAPVPADVMTNAQMEATFTSASIGLLNVGGTYYGMPTDVQTLMMFYNDDLFTAAGLDPTKDFATWDDFRDAAIKLTKSDGGSMSQAGVDITSSPYQYYYTGLTVADANGLVDDTTHKVTYASDSGYQMWERITGLVTTDKVDNPEFLTDQSKFGTGLAGMTLKEYTFNGVYPLSNPDLNFSVHMPPPLVDGQTAPVVSTSWAYAVSADCKNQAGAWNWISYLTSEAAQRIWIAGGGELPSRTALLGDKTLAADPAVAAGFAALAKAVPYDSIGWDDTFAIEQQIWDSIVVGDGDVKKAVDEGAAAEDALYESKGVIK
ncbi:MAG: extracellular solute-binding protein [Ilumatobacteraceae bacterium]